MQSQVMGSLAIAHDTEFPSKFGPPPTTTRCLSVQLAWPQLVSYTWKVDQLDSQKNTPPPTPSKFKFYEQMWLEWCVLRCSAHNLMKNGTDVKACCVGVCFKKKEEEASCLTKNFVSISVPHFASSDCALQVLSPASQSECRVHPLCQAAL